MYRAPPEVSRICIRKARDRAYQKHLDALKNVKSTLDTKQPRMPNSIGKNFKRYEIEKQRNLAIQNQNVRLVHRLDKILREEHFASQPPGRPHTLQGRYQKEQMLRITEENAKIVKAIQQSRPLLNRNDWYMHRIDHEYQHHKNAEYKQTLPMSEIIHIDEMEQSARRQSYRKDDEFQNIYAPKPPSTARPEYRPSRSSKLNNEENYQVHEPPPRPTTEDHQYNVDEGDNDKSFNGDISIHDEVEENVNVEFNNNNEEQDQNMSLKNEIHDELNDVQDKVDGEDSQQQDLSLRQEINETMHEETHEESLSIKLNIDDKKLEADGDVDSKDTSLSIKPQIDNEKLEADGDNDSKPTNPDTSLSIKPHIEDEKLEANGVQDTKETPDESLSIKPTINDEKIEANGEQDTKEAPDTSLSIKPHIEDEKLEANGVQDTKEAPDASLSIKPNINDEKIEANGEQDTKEVPDASLSIKPHIDNEKLEANGVVDSKDTSMSIKLHVDNEKLEANGVNDTPETDSKKALLQLGENANPLSQAIGGMLAGATKHEENKAPSNSLAGALFN